MKKFLVMLLLLSFGNAIAQTSRVRNEGACYVPTPIDASKGPANIEADIPFAPYDNSKPYDSNKGKAEVVYYYATSKDCNGIKPVTKPVIVIDGFDPGDTRDAGEIYYERLAYSNKNLGDSLRNLGYDVIILNFPKHEVARVTLAQYEAIPHKFMLPKDTITRALFSMLYGGGLYKIPVYQDHGGDYVERNAFTLVKLIQQINAQLVTNGSTEKLIIVGPSMGGLISRYALAYMEKNNMNHNTRLWISFDSPHNGANIPIGAQLFLNHLATEENNYDARVTVNNRLSAVFAKQILLSHLLGKTPNPPNSNAPFFYKAPIYYNNLSNALNFIGFPSNLRRVSLTNGASNGRLYDGNTIQGSETLYLEVDKRTGGDCNPICNPTIWEGKPLARGNVYMGFGYGQSGQIARYTKRRGILGALIGVWDETNYYYTAQADNIAYDIAPGGTYDLFQEIADEGKSNGWEWPVSYSANFQVYKKGHCFIPTKSALAFSGSNQDLGEALNNRNLICTKETPFDAYYAPNTNEGHTDLNTANVAWVLQQINYVEPQLQITSIFPTATELIIADDVPQTIFNAGINAECNPRTTKYQWEISSLQPGQCVEIVKTIETNIPYLTVNWQNIYYLPIGVTNVGIKVSAVNKATGLTTSTLLKNYTITIKDNNLLEIYPNPAIGNEIRVKAREGTFTTPPIRPNTPPITPPVGNGGELPEGGGETPPVVVEFPEQLPVVLPVKLTIFDSYQQIRIFTPEYILGSPINISLLPTGVYYIQIENWQTIIRKRLVINTNIQNE
jgi:hypothetical protein